MKKIKFILYGLLIGALCAVCGSFGFGAIVAALLLWRTGVGTLLSAMGFAIIYSAMFSILPGAAGGAYLARWLEKAERTQPEITRHSLLVGAAAGLVAGFGFIAIVLRFFIDFMTFCFAVLAILVAAGASFLAAKWLARKKNNFVITNSLP